MTVCTLIFLYIINNVSISVHDRVREFMKLYFNFRWQMNKGAFKYYVIKEVGGWGQKMEILDDLQYCKSSKSWVGGPKKVKTMIT